MTAVSVTAANVIPASGATIDTGLKYGATVTAGQSVYKDSSTSPATYKLFDADASAAAGTLAGIALNGGASGQPAAILTEGDYNPGGTVAVGTVYVGGATAGAINPTTDLASTWYSNVLGIATTASNIHVHIIASGVAVP